MEKIFTCSFRFFLLICTIVIYSEIGISEEDTTRVVVSGYMYDESAKQSDILWVGEDRYLCLIMLENGVIARDKMVVLPYSNTLVRDIGNKNRIYTFSHYNNGSKAGDAKVLRKRRIEYDKETGIPYSRSSNRLDIPTIEHIFAVNTSKKDTYYTLGYDEFGKLEICERVYGIKSATKSFVFDIEYESSPFTNNGLIDMSENEIIAVFGDSSIHFYDMNSNEYYTWDIPDDYLIGAPMCWGAENCLYFWRIIYDESEVPEINLVEESECGYDYLMKFDYNTKENDYVKDAQDEFIRMPNNNFARESMCFSSDGTKFVVLSLNEKLHPEDFWLYYVHYYLNVFSLEDGFIEQYQLVNDDSDYGEWAVFYPGDITLRPIIFFLD